MSQRYNSRMNLSLTGTSFTDELHSDVGVSSFTLDHDFFINDAAEGEVLIIRTAQAGGGTLLVEDVDYSISNQDTVLSDADHVDMDCYSDITIINAAYQTGDLYFSGKYVADSVDSNDVSQVTWQYESANASATLSPTGYTTYGCTAGTNGIKLTLPAVSEFYTNIRIEFIKLDATNSAVMIDGNSAETINGLASIYLLETYQKVTLMCTGTEWIIIQGTLVADSGWVNTNDWTNRHLGTSTVVYDGKAGTFQIGELVKEATSNNTGIIVADSGTALTLWRCTGTGIFTNDRVLTGQISSATANVNNASTDKNTDYDFYHGFDKRMHFLNCDVYCSTDKTEANAQWIGPESFNESGDYAGTSAGIVPTGVDTNNILFQTGTTGLRLMGTNGVLSVLDSEDYYYRIVVRFTI